MINQKILKLIYVNCLKHPQGAKIFVDLETVKKRFQEVRNLAPKNLSLIFPVKSFPHKVFFESIAPLINGFEFTNKNEYELVSEVIDTKTHCLISNFFDQTSLNSLVSTNVLFDVGYLDQLDELDPKSKISLRIKPPSELYQGEKTRFGLDASEVQSLSQDQTTAKRVQSLHFHLGFERTTLADLKIAIQMCLKYRDNFFPNLDSINIGGGITTLPHNDLLLLFKYIEGLDINITMEAGRYFTENACYGVGQILSLRSRDDTLDILTDLSRECHLKWAWPKSFNILNTKPNQSKTSSRDKIRIFGNTAFEGDLILSAEPDRALSLSKGDHVVVDNVSGYSIAWNHSFNGLPAAKIFFL
tara:strand:+ start:5834 stop:6907 length:1074 start_codon:yes stop_codon:yes gene_type:complete